MSIVVDSGLGVIDKFEPSIFDAIDVDEELTPVVESYGMGGEDFGWGEEVFVGVGPVSSREEVFDGVLDAVAEVGDGVAELLEDGNAGVARVMIGPEGADEFLEVLDAFFAKGIVVEAGKVLHGKVW